MATDQIIQDGQKKLLAKRAALSQTENLGRRIENTDFQEIANRCIKLAKSGENVVNLYQEKIYGEESKSEHENSWPLKCSGVPKLYSECTFENYQGHEKLITDLKEITQKDCSMVLRGNTGCGKTHLAVAILKIQSPSPYNSKFITAPDLLLKIRSSFSDGAAISEGEIIREYSEIPTLVLDDLGAEKTSEYAITTLYIILDRRIRECRKTIITTNLSKEEIEETFGARIASRLAGVENIKINMPDYRKKRK